MVTSKIKINAKDKICICKIKKMKKNKSIYIL